MQRTDDSKKTKAGLILELLEEEVPNLRRFLRRRGGNQHVEDAYQETYKNLLAAPGELSKMKNQPAYVLTVASRALRDVKGARKKIHLHTTSFDHQELERLADQHVAERGGPEVVVELQRHVSSALEKLPAAERDVLKLQMEDRGRAEIARKLNLSVHRVGRLVTSAYTRLRVLLASEVQGDERK